MAKMTSHLQLQDAILKTMEGSLERETLILNFSGEKWLTCVGTKSMLCQIVATSETSAEVKLYLYRINESKREFDAMQTLQISFSVETMETDEGTSQQRVFVENAEVDPESSTRYEEQYDDAESYYARALLRELNEECREADFKQGMTRVTKSIYVDNIDDILFSGMAIPLSRFGLTKDDVDAYERGELNVEVKVNHCYDYLEIVYQKGSTSFDLNNARIIPIKPLGLADKDMQDEVTYSLTALACAFACSGAIPRYVLGVDLPNNIDVLYGTQLLFLVTESNVILFSCSAASAKLLPITPQDVLPSDTLLHIVNAPSFDNQTLQRTIEYENSIKFFDTHPEVLKWHCVTDEQINQLLGISGGGENNEDNPLTAIRQSGYNTGYQLANSNNDRYIPSEITDEYAYGSDEYNAWAEGFYEGYDALDNSTPSDELLQQWYQDGYNYATQGGGTVYGGMINNQYYSKLVDEWQSGAQAGNAEYERQMQQQMREMELGVAEQDGRWKGEYSDTEYKQSSNPYTGGDEEMAARWDSGYESGWAQNSYNPESSNYITPEQRLQNAYNEGEYAGSHDYSFGDTSNPYSSETQADLHERWAAGYQYGYDNA